MADANYECTDDEEDGEELDPRVQVSLNFGTDTRSRTDVGVYTCTTLLMGRDLNEPKIL